LLAQEIKGLYVFILIVLPVTATARLWGSESFVSTIHGTGCIYSALDLNQY